MKKNVLISLIFLLSAFIGYIFLFAESSGFKKLSAAEAYDRIIKGRDYAIGQAVKAGDYRCCIDPPCTMCYMEANKWNYFKAGTCACDDFAARGEETCPQCQRGAAKLHNEDNISCDVNAASSSCASSAVKSGESID